MAPAATETATSAGTDPHAEYVRRLDRRRASQAEQTRRERWIGIARLAVFLLGLILIWLALGPQWLSPAWLLVPMVAFFVLVYAHQQVLGDLSRAERAAAFYDHGLARLEDRWSGRGEPGTRFLDPEHPYAADLDLFGTGSLFELLCSARTRMGEETLATWLRGPADLDEVQARQTAIAELRPRLDLREQIALLGAGVPSGVEFDTLAAWGAAPAVLTSPGLRLAAAWLSALAVLALACWGTFYSSPSPVMVALMAEMIFALRLRARVEKVIGVIERRAGDLQLLAGLLARLENEPFTAPRLCRMQEALRTAGVPPSRRIAQLVRRIDWLNSRRNFVFAPIAALLLWTTRFAFALEAWRAAVGPALGRWLSVVGEFEALSALATYAYENPADPFPEMVAAGPVFEGEALGHPLLPRASCVRNDLVLGGPLRLMVVSGSNMSGKSTLLRTVGINAVLAQAGAPVRAGRLRLSPLAVGATLRIQDSLQAGRSRFYAEITRIRQLLDLARGSPPLLFLLDEIFHGTNSHDRRRGAEAVVRSLVDAGAIGLVTTHDLALTHIPELLGNRAANIHFEDQLEGGHIHFDYQVRSGIVPHSNGLALMRAVGLEV